MFINLEKLLFRNLVFQCVYCNLSDIFSIFETLIAFSIVIYKKQNICQMNDHILLNYHTVTLHQTTCLCSIPIFNHLGWFTKISSFLKMKYFALTFHPSCHQHIWFQLKLEIGNFLSLPV